ncbi:RIP metalloprotease RseP [Aurantiacibacter poecillastricola]|uniref:RIP metalloprotease RseP n=1 Tax=Aurantiacibacter poecillastricola TaxID=3064385 RepID=UPI00273E3D6E|nr:RIP metalloprotease RseP [Aurantiacibacter sp. 219JJ12-13]MDP5262704.1 RIP metalloprotease RseP [Aurantiacibacter sp. 219JJ12-13]
MLENPPFWLYIVGFLLMLGPLVVLHELGHYLVGRWFGVGAEAFSVGFGKEVAGFTDKRGTRWKLSALPLGGYVQFQGDMNPASQPDPDKPAREGDFQTAPLWQKALIVAAGPVANVLVALAIFAAFFMAIGKPVPSDPLQESTIAAFAEESPAREAGLQVGDRILSIEGEEMGSFQEVQQAIFLYPNRELDITVVRDGAEVTIPVTTRAEQITDRFGNESTIGLIGVEGQPSERIFEPVGLFSAIGLAWQQCLDTVDMMVTGIAQIFMGERSVKELGGPITIAKVSGEQLSLGWLEFTSFAALISLNLAFINLLPIPMLDGGHLAFYAVEAVRRKPASAQSQEWAFRTGMALVLALMLFVTIIDIAKLPLFGS